MDNKVVGGIVVGVSLLIGIVIFLFNRALSQIVNTSCSHGPSCPMWGSIRFHTWISIVIMVFVLLVGLYIMFFMKEYQTTKKKTSHKTLSVDEKKIVGIIEDSEGTIFQSNIVDSSGYTKVKVTRILDKLEGKGVIERKRRGMTNVVILRS